MYKRAVKTLARIVAMIAVFAAVTPSQAGFYQMEAPESLKKTLR